VKKYNAAKSRKNPGNFKQTIKANAAIPALTAMSADALLCFNAMYIIKGNVSMQTMSIKSFLTQ
jgi:hypothetical protein